MGSTFKKIHNTTMNRNDAFPSRGPYKQLFHYWDVNIQIQHDKYYNQWITEQEGEKPPLKGLETTTHPNKYLLVWQSQLIIQSEFHKG